MLRGRRHYASRLSGPTVLDLLLLSELLLILIEGISRARLLALLVELLLGRLILLLLHEKSLT